MVNLFQNQDKKKAFVQYFVTLNFSLRSFGLRKWNLTKYMRSFALQKLFVNLPKAYNFKMSHAQKTGVKRTHFLYRVENAKILAAVNPILNRAIW